MAFFHCSLEVQCAIHCATEPGSGCFFYAPTATRTYLFPVCHRRPLRPLFTSSRGPTSVTTFDSSVGRAELNKQTSLGRWFDSGSKEELLFAGLSRRVKANASQKKKFSLHGEHIARGAAAWRSSSGRWCDSGSKEEVLFAGLSRRVKANGGQKNCFPDRESNTGRGGESAESSPIDYQGEMGHRKR